MVIQEAVFLTGDRRPARPRPAASRCSRLIGRAARHDFILNPGIDFADRRRRDRVPRDRRRARRLLPGPRRRARQPDPRLEGRVACSTSIMEGDLGDAARNRLRTFLTAFGVFWGIFMLMAMLGFGSSIQSGMQRQMKGMATNLLFCWGQHDDRGLRRPAAGPRTCSSTPTTSSCCARLPGDRVPRAAPAARRLDEQLHRQLRQQDRHVHGDGATTPSSSTSSRSSTRPAASSTSATSPRAARSP